MEGRVPRIAVGRVFKITAPDKVLVLVEGTVSYIVQADSATNDVELVEQFFARDAH